MGRITRGSVSGHLNNILAKQNHKYWPALKEGTFNILFDEFQTSWTGEQAAMIYFEIISPLHLLHFTAAGDNRLQIEGMIQSTKEDQR